MAFFKKFGEEIRTGTDHLFHSVNHTLGKVTKPILGTNEFIPSVPKSKRDDFKKKAEIAGIGALAVTAAIATGGAAIPEEVALLGGAEAAGGGAAADLGFGAIGESLGITGLGEIGASFASIASKLGTAISVGGTIMEVGELIKVSKEEDKIEDKLSAVSKAIQKLSSIDQLETTHLEKFGKELDTIGKHVGVIDNIKVFLESKAQANETHFDKLESNIIQNHNDLQTIKQTELTIPKNLRALEEDITKLRNEEEEIEGALNQIKTRIDRPQNVADLINDLKDFDRPTDMLEYITENSNILNSLSQQERNRVLDYLIDNGAINAL